jgi:hypothetical protein
MARFSRWILRWALLLPLACSNACGGSQSRSQTAQDGVLRGEVVERAEGFSERPGWADAGQPVSRKDEYLRVVGYVAIDGAQRLEMGYRASDSYARAELIRFLSTRIVAVLKDRLDSRGVQELSERITESAAAWTQEIPVAQRYWEKRRDDGKESVHIWSRVDLSPEQLGALSQLVLAQGKDGSLPDSLPRDLTAHWDQIADPSQYRGSLPEGVFVPDWAKDGDRQTDTEFQFVCYGLAPDERTARIAAQSQCSVKFCKLFGVQITAETTVVEDLEGMSAKSEVKERCPDVRVVGRETRYQSGECGPKGCVFWIRQAYPASSYEEEKKRLAEPTIVRQEVVIQEGDKVYKDPALCERELRAYGQDEEVSVASLERRLAHLKRARKACEGVDSRDSGLFSLMTDLLQAPLSSFVSRRASVIESSMYDLFLYGSSSWFRQLTTARFFDQRLVMVIRLLSDAIPPLRAYEAYQEKPPNLARIQAACRPLFRLPFVEKPIAPTHAVNVHFVHVVRPKGLKDPEFRDFLMTTAGPRLAQCYGFGHANGDWVLKQLAADGKIDDQEWSLALRIMKRDEEHGLSCVAEGIASAGSPLVREQRVDQLLDLVARNQVRFPGTFGKNHEKLNSLQNVLGVRGLTPREAVDLALKWAPRFAGSEKAQTELAAMLLKKIEPTGRDQGLGNRQACEGYIETAERLASAFSTITTHDVSYDSSCRCLDPKTGLATSYRRAFVQALSVGHYRVCDHVTDDEWPGGIGARPQRPEPPSGSREGPSHGYEKTPPGTPAHPWDAAKVLQGAVNGCLYNTPVHHPYNGILSAWVTIETRASSSGFTRPRVRVAVTSSPRELRPSGKSYRWVTREDIRATEASVQSCIEKSVVNQKVPQDTNLATSSPRNVWLLYTGADMVDARWVP